MPPGVDPAVHNEEQINDRIRIRAYRSRWLISDGMSEPAYPWREKARAYIAVDWHGTLDPVMWNRPHGVEGQFYPVDAYNVVMRAADNWEALLGANLQPFILSYIGTNESKRRNAAAFRDQLASELVSRGTVTSENSAEPGVPTLGTVHLHIVSAKRDRESRVRTDTNIGLAKVRYMQQHNVDYIIDDKAANLWQAWKVGILPYQVYARGKDAFLYPPEFIPEVRRTFPTRARGIRDFGISPCPFPGTLDGTVNVIVQERVTGWMAAKLFSLIELKSRESAVSPRSRVGYNPWEAAN